MKYDKMVSINELLSREKTRRAINAILEMENEGGSFSVTELTRRTGLSRSFFYKNPAVRDQMNKVLKSEGEDRLRDQRTEILNGALQARIKLLEAELVKLHGKNDVLEKDNLRLSRAVEQLEIEILRVL